MSKPKAPKAPDPVATAQAQTQSNADTARLSTELNRVNEVGPTGNVTYSNDGDRWTRTTTLSPNQQALQTGQENLGINLNNLATSQIDKVQKILGSNFTPRRFNYNGEVEKNIYDLATNRLGKEFGRAEETLRSDMANRGITAGSEAFTGEMAGFNEGKGNAYSQAQLAARAQGRAEEEADYSREYAADLAQRQVPLQEIMGIMNGTPLQGVDPASIYTRGVSDTDVAGITQQGFNNQMGIYNQQMGARNGMLGGLFGLGGAYLGAR